MRCSFPGCTEPYSVVEIDKGLRWCVEHNPNADAETIRRAVRSRTHKPKEPVKLTGQVTRVQTVTLDATQLRQLIAEAVGEKLGIEVKPGDLTFESCGVQVGISGVTICSEVVETLSKPPVTRGG